MTPVEFRNWLNDEVAAKRMTVNQRNDLLDQKGAFDSNYPNFQQAHANEIVGYVDNTQLTSDNIHDLLDQAQQRFPGRMVYFEPIGFDLY